MSLYSHGHRICTDITLSPRSQHTHGPHFIPRILAHPWILPRSHGHHMNMDSHGQDRHRNITLSPGSWHSLGYHPVPTATTFIGVMLSPWPLHKHGHHLVPRVPALTWTSLCPRGRYIDMSVPLSSWIQIYGHQFAPRVPALTRTSHTVS